jgi:hypothetical protein
MGMFDRSIDRFRVRIPHNDQTKTGHGGQRWFLLKEEFLTGLPIGTVAQLVERRPEEPGVGSSNLSGSTSIFALSYKGYYG